MSSTRTNYPKILTHFNYGYTVKVANVYAKAVKR